MLLATDMSHLYALRQPLRRKRRIVAEPKDSSPRDPVDHSVCAVDPPSSAWSGSSAARVAPNKDDNLTPIRPNAKQVGQPVALGNRHAISILRQPPIVDNAPIETDFPLIFVLQSVEG